MVKYNKKNGIKKGISGLKKRWITAKEINQFCYCPEQWRLAKLHRQGLVEADEQKLKTQKRLFQKGKRYHRKKAVLVWVKTKGTDWAVAVLLVVILLFVIWTVMNA